MKEAFESYLELIGVTKPVRDRIEVVCNWAQAVYPLDTADMFINDYIKEDGERVLQSLVLFSEEVFLEAPDFLTEDQIEFNAYHRRVFFWHLEKKDYDFETATERSRLYLTFNCALAELYGEMRASGRNCDYLRDIFRKYIVPNILE